MRLRFVQRKNRNMAAQIHKLLTANTIRRFIACKISLIIICSNSQSRVYAFDSVSRNSIHQNITRKALGFLVQNFQDEIIDGNSFWFDFRNYFHPEVHFDSCNFVESFKYINERYHDVLKLLHNGDRKAFTEFGHLLHTVQDFYAHSNRIELGHDNPKDLFEKGLSFWNQDKPLDPYQLFNEVRIIEGEPQAKNDDF